MCRLCPPVTLETRRGLIEVSLLFRLIEAEGRGLKPLDDGRRGEPGLLSGDMFLRDLTLGEVSKGGREGGVGPTADLDLRGTAALPP